MSRKSTHAFCGWCFRWESTGTFATMALRRHMKHCPMKPQDPLPSLERIAGNIKRLEAATTLGLDPKTWANFHAPTPNVSLKREEGIRYMLAALGENPDREGLKETPRRVVAAWSELCRGYQLNPKDLQTEFAAESYDEMVAVGPIRFYSTCEHHLLPFFGNAWVAYVPKKSIIGLSKIPRLVEIYSRRLQNQERMTVQIAETLMSLTKARGAACLVKGQHLCMMARGVKQETPFMSTSALRGVFRTQPTTRAEFYALTE